MTLTAIILTYNEAKHLARCIESLAGVSDTVVMADCFSTDATLDIARAHGARVVQRAWVNHATQFNWLGWLWRLSGCWGFGCGKFRGLGVLASFGAGRCMCR